VNLVTNYPEISPLDYDPPVSGFVVTPQVQNPLSPEECERARRANVVEGRNPYSTMYGNFEWAHSEDYDKADEVVLTHPSLPPRIKRRRTDNATINFLRDLCPGREAGGIWKVSINGKVGVLKLVRAV
jgi:hypothetical protein